MIKDEKVSPSGINIYQDDRGRTIYFDRFTKRGYVITDKETKNYMTFQNRFFIALAALILTYSLVKNIFVAIFVCLLVVVALELAFRKKFLARLTYMSNFKPMHRQCIVKQLANKTSKTRLLLKSILYLTLAVLLVLNALEKKHDITLIAVSYGIAGIVTVVSIVHFIAYFNTKNKK